MAVALDAWLKALAAAVTLVYALVLWNVGARRFPERWFCVFLGLVAANQAAEALRAVVSDPVLELRLFKLGTIFAALDPVALLLGILRRSPRTQHRITPAIPAMVAAFILMVWSVMLQSTPQGGERIVQFHATYTALAYVLAVYYAFDVNPSESRSWLLAALAIALVPRAVNSAGLMTNVVTVPLLSTNNLSLPVALVTAALLLTWIWWRGPETGRRVLASGLAAAALLVLILDVIIHFAFVALAEEAFASIGKGAASIRWHIFCVFLSSYLVRAQGPATSVLARRTAGRVLLATTFLAAAAMVIAIVEGVTDYQFHLSPLETILIVAVLVLSQGFRGLADQVAARFYRVPPPGDIGSRQEAYRAAAENVVLSGRQLADAPELQRLRRELELDERHVAILEQRVEAEIPRRIRVGDRVGGRYVLKEMLGAGGEGRVFLAFDDVLKRQVVVKEVPLADPSAQSKAISEARAACAVEHPNVVTVYDVLMRANAILLIMEYCPGGSLQDRLATQGLRKINRTELAKGLLAGLSAIHRQGIVHRDIKPANILFDGQGNPKIADFGIAGLAAGTTWGEAERATRAGSPGFMAPEQATSSESDPRSDIYALGRILRLVHPSPDDRMARVLDRATAAEPSKRWQSVDQIRAAMFSSGTKQ